MRFLAIFCWLLLLCHCAPAPRQAPRAIVAPAEKPPPSPSIPQTPADSPRATSAVISGITLEGVAFDSRSHRLVVVDQARGPGSRFPDAESAARPQNGLAAANAGFFTPEGNPLGLVASGGKRSGAWNAASSLGSGIWHEDSSGNSAITRRETLGKSTAATMRELIQAGPMLVENGRPVSGLDATKHSVRSFLLWDGGTRWWLGRASACSLAELASALARSQAANWPVRHALNLDGGRSSDLWISAKVPGGPVSRRAPWNRPVRNFLILKAR
jgi:uncharacterized protein YigE (DUF2233 family)